MYGPRGFVTAILTKESDTVQKRGGQGSSTMSEGVGKNGFGGSIVQKGRKKAGLFLNDF